MPPGPLVLLIPVAISPPVKIPNGPNGRLRAWGKLISEKILMSIISWHCPFKYMGEAEERVGPFVEIMRDNSLRTIKG